MLIAMFSAGPAFAETDFRCYVRGNCQKGSGARTASPTKSSQIRVNPSAVPTEKGLGLEAIFYKNEADLSLVQGLGRVGAAISPSNSEETFFGSPGLEMAGDLYERKLEKKKYPSRKVTLAAAADLIKREGSSLRSFGLKLGLMGKYNRETEVATPGAGVNAILGPFTLGFAMYRDETRLPDFDPVTNLSLLRSVRYTVQTSSVGLYLNSFILDFSELKLEIADTHEVSTVRLLTGTLMIERLILTLARRVENSERPEFDFELRELRTQQIKTEYFGGLQFNATKNLVVGLLYNYYLVREGSIVGTLFF